MQGEMPTVSPLAKNFHKSALKIIPNRCTIEMCGGGEVLGTYKKFIFCC